MSVILLLLIPYSCRGTKAKSLVTMDIPLFGYDLSAHGPAVDCSEGGGLCLRCFYCVKEFRMHGLECPCDCHWSSCTYSPLHVVLSVGEDPSGCL